MLINQGKKLINKKIILCFFISILILLPIAPISAKDQYRTRTEIINDLLSLEASYPSLMSHEIVGHSAEMREIYLFKIGNINGGQVLIDASIHGNEHATTETLYFTIEWLLTSQEEEAQRILENNYLLTIPIVNIDNYGTSRYNAHAVDLNRNFETGWGDFNDYARGEYPLSEPETQTLHNVITSYDISWYLNLHTGDYRISPPWAYQTGVPEQTIHQNIYQNYVTISNQRGESTIPFVIRGNYAGGTARDEGYANGAAYTYLAELETELKPGMHIIKDKMVPKLICLTTALCQASETATPDTEPPIISEIETTEITATTATITWGTDEPSNSMINYGPTTSLGTTITDTYLVTNHQMTLTELTEETTYFYEIQSTDTSGNTATDTNEGNYYTLTTIIPDATPPQITEITGDTTATTGESVTVIATISDNIEVTQSNLYYTPIDETELTIPLTKDITNNFWTANIPVNENKVGTITYYIVAQDASNNLARDPTTSAYAITVTDNDSPNAEAGPNITAYVDESINFDASLSEDNIGITSISWDFDNADGIQEDATGITASNIYTSQGTYIVTLTVKDEAGNMNIDTLEITIITQPIQPTANFNILISRIDINRGPNTWSSATVTVSILVDGSPLKEAMVYGDWSGAYEESVTGITTAEGTITFSTSLQKNAGTFTFTINSIQKNEINYVLDGETSIST